LRARLLTYGTEPFLRRSILILLAHLHLGLPNCLFPSGYPYRRETGTSSIDLAQLSTFYLKTESSIRNFVFFFFCNINRAVFLNKDRTMVHVQKHDIYAGIQSSQTFRSFFFFNLCSGTSGSAATTGLLYQPQVPDDR
jgi:hypothetical protein